MERRAGRFYFWAVTITLIFVAAFCCAEKVKGRESLNAQERRYREMEEELMSGTREILRAQGLENSGVMLTRVVESDNVRQYTLTVHHGRIDRMCDAEREALMVELETFAAGAYEKFVGDRSGQTDCIVLHKFFLDD